MTRERDTRVLLVDDHPVVRAGLRALLESSPGIVVVGEAATGEAALATVASSEAADRPDVVLMDLRLGDGIDGVTTTARLRARPDAPHVLVLTTYDTDADILRAVEAGAVGYLLKDAAPDDLITAIHAAAAGQTALAPQVAQRLMVRLRDDATSLTPRELEILGLVAEGRSNAEVASALFISEATVKSHLVHTFTKLDVGSRTAAVAEARRRGLLG